MTGTSTPIWTLGGRALALACAASLCAALVPAAAFAEDAASDETTILQVSLRNASTGAVSSPAAGAFTQSELESLAVRNRADKYRYAYSEGSTVYAGRTSNFLTLEQLVDACGLESAWHEGSSITVTGSDGSELTQTYAEASAAQCIYPEGTANGISGSPVKTEPAFALDEFWTRVSGTMTVRDVTDSTPSSLHYSDTTSCPHYLFGAAADASSYPTSVKNVTSVTISYTDLNLQVATRNAKTGAETDVASYTQGQLDTLAQANSTPAAYLYTKDGAPTVLWTDRYVTASQLLGTSGKWAKGASLEVTALDGSTATFGYGDLLASENYYGDYTASIWSNRNTTATVVPVVALSHYQGTITGSQTADQVKDALAAIAAADDAAASPSGSELSERRWLVGYTNGSGPVELSQASPAPVVKLTVVYSPAENGGTTSGGGSTTKKPTAKKTSMTVNVKTVTAASLKAAARKAGASTGSLTKLTLGTKVKTLRTGAFKPFKKLKTLVVKTKKLTRKSVKGSLRGSAVKTVRVQVGSKKANKKYAKAYKNVFAKKACGKKVKVTR